MSANSILKSYFEKVIEEISKKINLVKNSSDEKIKKNLNNFINSYINYLISFSNIGTNIALDQNSQDRIKEIVANRNKFISKISEGFSYYYNYGYDEAKNLQIKKLEEDIEDANDKISDYEGRNNSKETYIDFDGNIKRSLFGLKLDIEAKEADITDIDSEIGILNIQIKSKSEELNSLEKELNNILIYENQIKSLEKEISNLETKNKNFEKQLEEKTTQLKKIKEQLEAKQLEAEGATGEELNRLNKEILAITNTLENYKEQINVLETTISENGEKVINQEKEISYLNKEIERIKNSNSESRKNEIKEEISEINTSILEKEEDKKEIIEEINKIYEEKNKLEKEIFIIKKEIENNEEEIERINSSKQEFGKDKSSVMEEIKKAAFSYCNSVNSFSIEKVGKVNIGDTEPTLTRLDMAKKLNWLDGAPNIDEKLSSIIDSEIEKAKEDDSIRLGVDYTTDYDTIDYGAEIKNFKKIGKIYNVELDTSNSSIVFNYDGKGEKIFYINQNNLKSGDKVYAINLDDQSEKIEINFIDLIGIFIMLGNSYNKIEGIKTNIANLYGNVLYIQENINKIVEAFKNTSNDGFIEDKGFVQFTNFDEWWRENYVTYISNIFSEFIGEKDDTYKNNFADFVNEFITDIKNENVMTNLLKKTEELKKSAEQLSDKKSEDNTSFEFENAKFSVAPGETKAYITINNEMFKYLRNKKNRIFDVDVEKVVEDLLISNGFAKDETENNIFGYINCNSFFKGLFSENKLKPKEVLIDNLSDSWLIGPEADDSLEQSSLRKYLMLNYEEQIKDEDEVDTSSPEYYKRTVKTYMKDLKEEVEKWTE